MSRKSNNHRPQPTSDTKWKSNPTMSDSTQARTKEKKSNQFLYSWWGNLNAANTKIRQRTGQTWKPKPETSSHKGTQRTNNTRTTALELPVGKPTGKGERVLLVPKFRPMFKYCIIMIIIINNNDNNNSKMLDSHRQTRYKPAYTESFAILVNAIWLNKDKPSVEIKKSTKKGKRKV